MSEFDQSFPAAQIARELGIQVSVDDVPKLVAALHRAYGTGLRDGASAERRACAQLAADFGPDRPIVARNPSQIIIGRWEGEQAASGAISAAILKRGAA